jgi:hypothetical protein
MVLEQGDHGHGHPYGLVFYEVPILDSCMQLGIANSRDKKSHFLF